MSGWMLTTLFLLVAYVGFIRADDKSARLLISKTVLNQVVVTGKDLTVHYELYNVGPSSATGVELTDTSFKTSEFKHISGLSKVRWEHIGSSSNVSHTIVLRPLLVGSHNITAAHVSYIPSEGQQPINAYSSEPGEYYIFPERDYDRLHSSHWLEWSVFGVLTLPSIGMPLLLWNRSRSKYADRPKHSKKH